MSLRSHPTHRRPLRRSLLAAGALLAVPVLSSCGFNYATDRVNTLSAGISDREGEVDVLGAVVIAGEDDLGVFIASLVNNSPDTAVTFTGLEPGTDTAALTPVDPAVAVEVTPRNSVDLIDDGGIEVSGTFGAGDFVDVTLTFDQGQVTTINVPVVVPCRQYDPALLGIEVPTTVTGTEAEPEEHAEEADGEHAELPGEYSCDAAEPVEHGPPEGE